jgi:hypothetical protein
MIKMSFFKKIFGIGKRNDINPNKNIGTSIVTPKQTLFDFFLIDIRNIPNESFIEDETKANINGRIAQNFRKKLSYKECEIFDTLEVKVINGSNKIVTFKSFLPDNINFDSLRILIDNLSSLYGNDIDDKGRFTNNDINDYKDKEFYMLFGRSWLDFPKYKYPLSISRNIDEVSISIWGLN